jgi:hypothetical protein
MFILHQLGRNKRPARTFHLASPKPMLWPLSEAGTLYFVPLTPLIGVETKLSEARQGV